MSVNQDSQGATCFNNHYGKKKINVILNLSLYRHIRVHLFPNVVEVRIRGLSTNKQLIHKNPPAIGVLHSLKLTANAPENGPSQKEISSSSNHPVSGANLLLVSGSVILLTLPAIDAWKFDHRIGQKSDRILLWSLEDLSLSLANKKGGIGSWRFEPKGLRLW